MEEKKLSHFDFSVAIASIDATLITFDFLTDDEISFLTQFKEKLIKKREELFPNFLFREVLIDAVKSELK